MDVIQITDDRATERRAAEAERHYLKAKSRMKKEPSGFEPYFVIRKRDSQKRFHSLWINGEEVCVSPKGFDRRADCLHRVRTIISTMQSLPTIEIREA